MASYVGYIRVSDVAGRNGDSFISPVVQRETIQRLAAAKGLELGDVVEEFDVSGGKKIEERKLGELVKRIERGEHAGLIVWKLSRFSRSLSDCATVAERIMESGGHLLADDFDSRAGSAHTLLGVLAGLAHDQRLERKAGWAEARKRAIKRGVPAYKTPYGYQRGEDGRLVPNGTAETVRLILKLKAEGKQLSSIARALEGTPSPSGGSKWPHSTLAQIVKCRVYLGEIQHGDYLNREAHEAIVDETTWQLAQSVKPRREQNGKAPRSAETISAGLARCAGCGHTLKTVVGYGGALRLYCKHDSYKETCTARALIRADELDPYVESWFLEAIEGAQDRRRSRRGSRGASGGAAGRGRRRDGSLNLRGHGHDPRPRRLPAGPGSSQEGSRRGTAGALRAPGAGVESRRSAAGRPSQALAHVLAAREARACLGARGGRLRGEGHRASSREGEDRDGLVHPARLIS